MSLLFIYF